MITAILNWIKKSYEHVKNTVSVKGNRNYQDGLWEIPITKTFIQDKNYYSILN